MTSHALILRLKKKKEIFSSLIFYKNFSRIGYDVRLRINRSRTIPWNPIVAIPTGEAVVAAVSAGSRHC